MLLSSIGFSAKAVMAKLLYRQGLSAETVLALRMGLALPLFAFSVLRKERRAAPLGARRWLAIVALGAGLYYASALADFLGLRDVSAGLERVILFTYPTWVVLLAWLALRDRLRARQLLALLITYCGIAIAFAGEQHGGVRAWRGAAWVLLSSLTYAAYLVAGTRYIHKLGAERFTAIALSAACVAAILRFLLSDAPLPPLRAEVVGLGAALALISTVLPTFALAVGIRRIGPGSSAILGTLGPVSTLVLANWFLGEPIRALQVIGTLFVVAGATWLALKPS